ncbi:2-acylglycerol O-acyltransferase 2-B-like [Nomascus leucogenys]|uniref:2-acylglycerol O-acyltransferase 2-B-like n=1 Tax=Nomascus leucogenys TaxID=61853 RepID=UPI00122DBAD1|nr:2-acylglycerol O-acyltransferase 2-B-like [Nomascus leucogenys]
MGLLLLRACPDAPGSLALAFLSWAWMLVVLYLVWLYWDRNTPRAGGRRSAWVCNWAVWRHYCDYFPLSLKLQSWTPPGTTSLTSTLTGSWSWEPSPTSAQSPRASPASSRSSRHTCSCCLVGSISPSSGTTSCQVLLPSPQVWSPLSRPRCLRGGQVAVLAVGGPLEALEAKPGQLSLRIRNQKRFVKATLELGENELFQRFPNPPSSWVWRAQEALHPLLSVALPLFLGRRGLPLPFRAPIRTVVGAAIPAQQSPPPSPAQVDSLQARYVGRLTQLFEEHKARYCVPADRHLVLT